MRTVQAPQYDESVADDPRIGLVDYKDAPHTVLEIVDRQLDGFGLEVVMVDTGDDSYQWRIQRKT